MEDLSLHILDIAENAVAAGATRIRIEVGEDSRSDRLIIEVADDGKGMDTEAAEKVLDPFFTTRTTRRVGLGVPLLRQAAEAAKGGVNVKSVPGLGTVVRATFQLSHVDRQPLGNIAATITTLIARSPAVDFTYTHRKNDRNVCFTTDEMRKHLDGLAINSAAVLSHVLKYLNQEEESLDHNE